MQFLVSHGILCLLWDGLHFPFQKMVCWHLEWMQSTNSYQESTEFSYLVRGHLVALTYVQTHTKKSAFQYFFSYFSFVLGLQGNGEMRCLHRSFLCDQVAENAAEIYFRQLSIQVTESCVYYFYIYGCELSIFFFFACSHPCCLQSFPVARLCLIYYFPIETSMLPVTSLLSLFSTVWAPSLASLNVKDLSSSYLYSI